MEKWERWVIIVRGGIFLLMCSGILYGFPALEVSMAYDGTYRWLCPAGSSVNQPCQPQLEQYSLMFISATTAYMVVGPMFGQMVDKYGSRKVNLFTSLVMGTGIILFMISSEEFPMYTLSFCFLTSAGACVYFQGLLLPMYSPENAGMINSIVNNSWDASACMFMLFQIGSENGFKLNNMFLTFLIFGPVCMCLSGYWLLPSYSTERRMIRQMRINTTALDQVKRGTSLAAMSMSFSPSATKGLLHFLTHPQFMSLSTSTAVLALRAYFFMSSYMLRLKNIDGVNEEMIQRATYFYSVIFPITAVLLTPIVGYLLDVCGLPMTYWVQNMLAVFHVIFSMCSSEWTLYVATFTLVAFRTIQYSALSVECGQICGFENVALTVGISLELQAVMTLLQFPLLMWVNNDLGGNFFYADILTGMCVAPVVAYTMYITYKQGSLFKKTEDQYEEIEESKKVQYPDRFADVDSLRAVPERRILLNDAAADVNKEHTPLVSTTSHPRVSFSLN